MGKKSGFLRKAEQCCKVKKKKNTRKKMKKTDMKANSVSTLHLQPHHSAAPEISLYPLLKNFS